MRYRMVCTRKNESTFDGQEKWKIGTRRGRVIYENEMM